jgi:serine/threonine protein kinase/tetratricopeptide (TPR) repeat protein
MVDSDDLIGRILGGSIRIRKLLGRGGMGAVYEGYQEKLDRKLAVKVMTPEHAQNPVAPDYFLREARAASRLRHPNIIQIFDFGEEDDLLYIAMEYVPGRSLQDIIDEESPLAPERIVDILDQTLAALEEAHAKKVIHRDLKPENLMVEKGRDGDFVKVLDFGIAKPQGPDEDVGPITRSGQVIGTPEFMSPEQARGDQVDPRSDLFAIGAVLYNMLTGKLPFTAKTVAATLVELLQEDPPPPSAARPDLEVHPGLEAVCLRALKKEVDLRYESAAAFRKALQDALDESKEPAKKEAPKMFVFKDRDSKKARADSLAHESTSGYHEAASDSAPAETERAQAKTVQTGESDPAEADATGDSSASAYDFDLDEFREDLMGQQVEATVLVVHQRASGRVKPDEQKELRETLQAQAERVARQFEGIVLSRRGNCLPLLFRVDSNSADHARRATEAALDLRRHLRRATPDHVIFSFAIAHGDLHLPSDDDYTRLSGETIDRAVESARATEDGLILVTDDEVRAHLEEVYELGDVGDDAAVEGVRQMQRILDDAVELVGRDAEVAGMLAALGRLGRGEGGSLAYVGETGMGKTALVAELTRLAQQRGFLALGARHRRPGAEGIRDVLRQWLSEFVLLEGGDQRPMPELLADYDLPDHVVELLGRWGKGKTDTLFGQGSKTAVPGEEFDADEAAVGALRQLFSAVSDERPCVLVVDQIESGSKDVEQFLSGWAEFCDSAEVLFVASLRTRSSGDGRSLPDEMERVDVGPLDEEASRRLLQHHLGSAVATSVVERLADVAGGMPVYLEQLAEQYRKHEFAEDDDFEKWLDGVETLGGALRARLFGVPTSARNVLGVLAVLGSGAHPEWVEALAADKWSVGEALQTLYDDGLIRAKGQDARLYFDPPIFRRVVYRKLSKKRGLRMHAQAAEYFSSRLGDVEDGAEEREFRSELSKHLAKCGKFVEAFQVTEDLARRALASFEYASARQFYRKALELGDKSSEIEEVRLARVRLELARIERASGNAREAEDMVRPVFRRQDLPDSLRNEAALDLAELWLDEEDTSRVETLVRRALEGIREQSDEAQSGDVGSSWLLVRGLKVLADVLERQGKLGQAAEALIEAVELNSQRSTSDADDPWRARLLWEPLNQLGRLRLRSGDTAEAATQFERALELSSRLGDIQGELTARANMASMYATEENYEKAYETLGYAREISRQIGDLKSLSRLEYNLGLLYAQQHRWNEARDALESSRELAQSLGWREGIALTSEQLRVVDQQV